MIVTLRLFAVARQRVGAAEVGVELAGPATVGELKRAVAEQYPALAPMLPGMMVAVEGEYAAEDRRIEPDQEVALIPPVSGGSPPSGRAGGGDSQAKGRVRRPE